MLPLGARHIYTFAFIQEPCVTHTLVWWLTLGMGDSAELHLRISVLRVLMAWI